MNDSIGNLVLENLRDYMVNASILDNRPAEYDLGNAFAVLNGDRSSMFNYVFLRPEIENIDEDTVIRIVNFLKERGCDATLPLEGRMKKTQKLFIKHGIKLASVPRKAIIDATIPILTYKQNILESLEFRKVNSVERLAFYDQCTAEIFSHKDNTVTHFYKGLTKVDFDTSPLQAFTVHRFGSTVGTCAMLINKTSKTVGYYADGVMRNHRNQGIGTALLEYRRRIARNWGCEYIVAESMPMSINMYTNAGAKMVGGLKLYVTNFHDH